VIITCPKCRSRYSLKPGSAAEKVRCKKCQTVIPVRPGTSAKAAPSVKKGPTRIVSKTRQTVKAGPERKAAEAVAPEAFVGRTIGGYEIIRKLGEGGMGAVYEARQISLDRSVALKVLPANLASNKSFITRFKRESLAAAKLNHSNIIQVYDVGEAEGTYYYAMEYVRGRTLHEILLEEGRMDPTTAAGYVIQAARALEYAHRNNIIHRDIKPENIMVNEEGAAKVADLGLARRMKDEDLSVTATGAAIGTPYYMAPEQASDAKRVDHRADVYSLGCTLYELITGRIPFEGRSAYEIMTKHMKEPLTVPEALNPDVSRELSAIVKKMMAKDKEDRFQSMTEVVRALEEYVGVRDARAGYQPQMHQITVLQAHAQKVRSVQKNIITRLIFVGMCGIVLLMAVVSLKIGPRFALGLAGYVVLTVLFYFSFFGLDRKTYLYRRVRGYLFASTFSDWVVMIVVAGAAVCMIVLLGLLGTAIVALALSLASAGAYYGVVKRPILGKQDGAIEDIKELLKGIRKKGVSEEDIQLFIFRHGGDCALVICEQIFGYESVREMVYKKKKVEPRGRTLAMRLRERVIDWINYQEKKRPFSRGPVHLIFGAKGRIIWGTLLALAGALSAKGIVFENLALMGSYEYALFSLSLFLSGFASSEAMRWCLYGSFLFSEPFGLYARHVNRFLAERFAFLDAGTLSSFAISLVSKLPYLDETSASAYLEDAVTPLLLAALILFIFSFIAALLLREQS